MMNNYPLVSIITPTTPDRERFNERCRQVVAMQDYPNIEHIIEYDNSVSLGEKMNRMIAIAKGDIIVNIDSDDIFAPDWISKSVDLLLSSKADVIGLKAAYFHNPVTNELWLYTYPDNCHNLHGGTMTHTKSFWERNKYLPMMVGYDNMFTRSNCKTATLDYSDGFVATIHNSNVSPKNTTGERWQLIENIPTNLHTLLGLFDSCVEPLGSLAR